jgi:hypothetical protein
VLVFVVLFIIFDTTSCRVYGVEMVSDSPTNKQTHEDDTIVFSSTPQTSTSSSSSSAKAASKCGDGQDPCEKAYTSKVAGTLSHLGGVLARMYGRVKEDEAVFKSFKHHLLEDEVRKAEKDLSWPAIRDLVAAEIDRGHRGISSQISDFKLEIMDMVQKGLDGMRGDLRSTVIGSNGDEHQPASTAEQPGDSKPTKHSTSKREDELDISHKKGDNKKPSSSDIGDEYSTSAKEALMTLRRANSEKIPTKVFRERLIRQMETLEREQLKKPSDSTQAVIAQLHKALVGLALQSRHGSKGNAAAARDAVEAKGHGKQSIDADDAVAAAADRNDVSKPVHNQQYDAPEPVVPKSARADTAKAPKADKSSLPIVAKDVDRAEDRANRTSLHPPAHKKKKENEMRFIERLTSLHRDIRRLAAKRARRRASEVLKEVSSLAKTW